MAGVDNTLRINIVMEENIYKQCQETTTKKHKGKGKIKRKGKFYEQERKANKREQQEKRQEN